MKHIHTTGSTVSAAPQLMAVQFKIDPPAAVAIHRKAAQSFDAHPVVEHGLPPWAYHQWMPNPYAARYASLIIANPEAATPFIRPGIINLNLRP